jgi:hypothetical protein
MAIKDIQEQLKKSEGQSGEFLFKQLEADLNAVYNAGYEGEKTPTLTSYWDTAYKEFSEEGKRAVKKGKSKEAKEVLKDLEILQKSIATTEEISGSGIGAGTMAMLNAVKPHIEKRAKALSKNEGIFRTMKKKATASAVGAVEGFASNLLAPLPFGAGEAIIEKTKGFLGAGKGDKVERQAEQAVSFAGRIEREGGEVAGTGGGEAAGNGGVVAGGGEGSGGNLGETNEILRDILEAVKPDKETAREEERESDRQHKELIDAMKAGGTVVGEDGEDGGDTNIIPLGGFGMLKKLLPVALVAAKMTAMIGGLVWAAWEMTEGELGKMGKKFGEKQREKWEKENPTLSKVPFVGNVLGAHEEGTENLKAQGMGAVFKLLNFLGLSNVDVTRHEGGKIKGPPGSESMYKLTAGERVFDNESSERMERVAKILEGTNFKTLEEYMQAGKDTIGYKVLMNTFTEGMLESAGGATLERMARKFGLAQTGQLGTTEYLHTEVPKYAMSPETVLKMIGRVEKFSRRSTKYQGMAELVKKTRASGKEWEGGTINVKKGDKNLAMQTVMAIAKAMATIEDSPEEKAAAKRYRDLSDQGRDQEAMRMNVEDYTAMSLRLEKDLAAKDAQMKLMFEQMETKYTNFNKQMTISPVVAGNQLNNAAYDKVGLRGQGGVINAPIINAPTSVSNNTITPPRQIAARGPRTPGFTDHLFS